MKKRQDLIGAIDRIDHKSYGMYKSLAGAYQFGDYILHIDHVQGDPFASPSRLRLEIPEEKHAFPREYYKDKHRRLALEDRVLRVFHRQHRKAEAGSRGSGKSGRISSCPVGQTILERIAVIFSEGRMEFRFELGFPARGRTILGREMTDLVDRVIPGLAGQCFFYRKWSAKDKEILKEYIDLADDQKAIREELKKRGLIAFLADGSILPRESGVSDRPMKGSVPFLSPESLRVELSLPHRGTVRGMGIPEGISLIVGGGYHGKSTLLKALEQGVYNHIPGDGREYVISADHAMKIRAEDGRSVAHTDISPFIGNLPGGQDTRDFSTENASGSTSQAANLIEAIDSGSRLLLLDEDTSATNFMIRDQVMASLVSDEQEPITPLLRHIRGLRQQEGISFVIVVGSSGDYLSVADLVLQMDHYHIRDVSEKAERICREAGLKDAYPAKPVEIRKSRRALMPMHYDRLKMKTMGTDALLVDRETIDVRYLEQLNENGQTVCLGLFLSELIRKLRTERDIHELVEMLYKRTEEEGLIWLAPHGYPMGHPVFVRKQEFYACLNRFRSARIRCLP